jgi:hypothetical protein
LPREVSQALSDVLLSFCEMLSEDVLAMAQPQILVVTRDAYWKMAETYDRIARGRSR